MKEWQTPFYAPYFHKVGFLNCCSEAAPQKAVDTMRRFQAAAERSSVMKPFVHDVNSREDLLQTCWQFTGKQRLIHINGEFDPWRSASVASEFRPGGPYKGTPKTPSTIIKGSRHCNDLSKKNGLYNSDIAASQKNTVETIGRWTKEFYGAHGRRRSI